MKYKTFVRLVFLPLVIILSSCFAVGSEIEDREVSAFSAIEVSGLAEVFITQSNSESVKVKVSGMPITDVITRVDNGKLIVTTKGFHSGESVKVYVNYLQLESIQTDGAAELRGTNTLNAEELTISTSGAGDIKELDIIASKLDVNINGAGNADLTVEVDVVNIIMKGAGDLDISGIARTQNVRSHNSIGSLDNGGLDYSEN